MISLRFATIWKTALVALTVLWALGSPSAAGAATVTRTVCASGCDHTTIQAAHDAAASGDTIEVEDAVHTEAGIIITKSLTLQGLGARATTVQAAAAPLTSSGRVFTVDDSSSPGNLLVTFKDMTIRHGDTFQGGGGGGIRVLATGSSQVEVLRCAITRNRSVTGGGIFTTGGHLILRNSTVDRNSTVAFNGGLHVEGSAELTNVTVSGNSSVSSGGAAFDGVTTLTNVTISGNSSQFQSRNGLIVLFGAAVQVSNTIVAGNAGSDCDLSGGPLIIPPGAPNLDGDGTCTGFTLQNANADLGPLANNGGPTDTHALGDNSAALDAGDDAICAAAPVNGVDQRGVTRPQEAHCDLGAYEKVPDRVCTSIDDSDPAVEYRIGWHLRTGVGASNGSYHRRMGSNQGNSLFNASTPTARVVFDGDEVIYHYVKSDRGGTARIYIDGVLIETLSYGPGQNGAENPTFGHSRTYSGLSDGQHELLIEHRTGTVYVDGFTFCGTGGGGGVGRFGSQTTVTNYPLGLLALLSTPVTVGADDLHVSVVVEGSAVRSVELRDPLSALLGSGGLLMTGNTSVIGLDAPVSSTGSHSAQVLPPLLGLLSPIEVSVTKTFRRP